MVSSVVDVADLALVKGIRPRRGETHTQDSLCEIVLKRVPHRDLNVSLSDWGVPLLSASQKYVAAINAMIPMLVFRRLQVLSDFGVLETKTGSTSNSNSNSNSSPLSAVTSGPVSGLRPDFAVYHWSGLG
jgi:hypothetical protein